MTGQERRPGPDGAPASESDGNRSRPHRTPRTAHPQATKYSAAARISLGHMREFQALGHPSFAESARRLAAELIDMHLRAVRRV